MYHVITTKQIFDIGWAIGTVAERKISDLQRGLKQYDKEDDCETARPWQLNKAQIHDAHFFKDEWGAKPNRLEACNVSL